MASPALEGGLAGKLVVRLRIERVAVLIYNVDINVIAVVERTENVIVGEVLTALIDQAFGRVTPGAKHDLPDGAGVYGPSLEVAQLCLYLLGLVEQHGG